MEQTANMIPGLDSAIKRVMRLLTGQRALVRRGDDFILVTAKGKRVRGTSGLPVRLVAEMQRLSLVVETEGGRLVSGRAAHLCRPRPQAESPLLWLAQRRDAEGRPLISEVEFAAGERLRRDFELAELSPRVTALWGVENAVSSTGSRRCGLPPDGLATAERVLMARTRLDRALKAAGEGLATILLEVCCLERGLEAAERRLGWPSRSGKVVLRLALGRLALHYGLRRGRETSGGSLDGLGLEAFHHGS